MRAFVALVVLPGLIGQSPVESDLLRRIRAGQLETAMLRRASDGTLEIWAELSYVGRRDGFVPLLGPDVRSGRSKRSALDTLTLWLQGGGDLLAMTGAEFHLRALGIDTADSSLRQHLMRPITSTGALGRAELLDRLVIVDLLQKRGCRAARAELTGLLNRRDVPEALRRRARAALATFADEPIELVRRRLDPATLPLPEQLDLAVVVDHSRLPDMTDVMARGSRVMALRQARYMGPVADTPPALAVLQYEFLRSPELPFGLVHRFGNTRIDHCCTSVTLHLDSSPQFTLCYQAAGEFEADVPDSDRPVAGRELVPEIKLVMTADRLTGHIGADPGKPAPEVAAQILKPTDAAVRVVVPEGSKLGELAKQAGLNLLAAELTVAFRDRSANLQLTIDTGSDTAAAAWCERAERLRRRGRDLLAADAGQPFRADPELAAACRALLATEVKVEGARVRAATTLPIMSAPGWEALAIATSW